MIDRRHADALRGGDSVTTGTSGVPHVDASIRMPPTLRTTGGHGGDPQRACERRRAAALAVRRPALWHARALAPRPDRIVYLRNERISEIAVPCSSLCSESDGECVIDATNRRRTRRPASQRRTPAGIAATSARSSAPRHLQGAFDPLAWRQTGVPGPRAIEAAFQPVVGALMGTGLDVDAVHTHAW